jgi:hypothetical protein
MGSLSWASSLWLLLVTNYELLQILHLIFSEDREVAAVSLSVLLELPRTDILTDYRWQVCLSQVGLLHSLADLLEGMTMLSSISRWRIFSSRHMVPSNDGLAMQRKDGFLQQLGEHVSWLVNRSDGLYVNGASCRVGTKMMKIDVDVFGSRPHCGSFCQS